MDSKEGTPNAVDQDRKDHKDVSISHSVNFEKSPRHELAPEDSCDAEGSDDGDTKSEKSGKSAGEITDSSCFSCRSPSSYQNFPCRCCSYCQKCAMKMATGGKCKKCHQFFTSMSKIFN